MKWTSIAFIQVILLSGFLCEGKDGLDSWTWRNPLPAGVSLVDVTFGDGKFIAVGDLGTVLTTVDGKRWQQPDFISFDDLKAAAFGKHCFVAVGYSGAIVVSSDGYNWSPASVSGVGEDFFDVKFGNGRFVAVGRNGQVFYSSNGFDWNSTNAPIGDDLISLTFGNGLFACLGAGGNVYVSADGANWMQSANVAYGISIAAGNGAFIVCGAYGELFVSANSVDWNDVGAFPFHKIKFAHGVFIGSGFGGISVSTDGINWLASDAANSTPVGVAWGNKMFVAVGTSGIASEVIASSNAVNWIEKSSGITGEIVSVARGKNIFVAVSDDGTILASSGGTKWVQVPAAPPLSPKQITFGNGKFVIAGFFGSGVSADGIHWTMSKSDNPAFNCVGYGNRIFIAGGWNGGVSISKSGTNWIQVNPSTSRLSGVVYGKGVYVVVGDSFWNGSQWINTVMTSRDGTNWTQTSSIPGRGLFSVTYGREKFVAVGTDGAVLYSNDGYHWNSAASGTGNWLYDVCYGDGFFLAVGSGGGPYEAPILSSTNGVDWSYHSCHANLNLNAAAYGDGRFVVVGTRGRILQSDRVFPENDIRDRDRIGFEVNSR
jgi:hypothetical protein